MVSNLRFTCTLSELRAVIVELVETFGCRFELETTSSAEPVILEAVERVMETIGVPDGGRGFGFTGGHFHDNWGNDQFRKVILNAFLWLAKAEVPEKGVE